MNKKCGCKKCSIDKISNDRKFNKKELLLILNSKYFNMYKFNLNNYKNTNSIIEVCCKEHNNIFKQYVKH